jgi:trehalose 6-phosphate synthase/phosphatase
MDDLKKAGLIEKYRKANNRLVLLDYDGTLVDYTSLPDTAILPEHLFDILIKLVCAPQTAVFIITGRGYRYIDEILNHLPIDIIAEHGAMIREKGIWKNHISNNTLWKETIIPILNQITSTCPKSFVEEKDFSLAWHYRNSETQIGITHSRKLIRILEKYIHSYNLKILDGKKVVEILSEETGKGKAVKKLTRQNNYDFILSIGDDATDEDMFKSLSNNSDAFTVKVGKGTSFAKYYLKSIKDVLSLLKQLSE